MSCPALTPDARWDRVGRCVDILSHTNAARMNLSSHLEALLAFRGPISTRELCVYIKVCDAKSHHMKTGQQSCADRELDVWPTVVPSTRNRHTWQLITEAASFYVASFSEATHPPGM